MTIESHTTPLNDPSAPGSVLDALRGGLIASCQAGEDSPLNSPEMIAALAASTERGGAVGFRVDRPENVAAVRARTRLPILGINKQPRAGFDVFITPTFEEARAVVDAGADLVAIDATARPRPDGRPVAALISQIHDECGVPVMADVSTYEEGLAAARDGADLIATTIAGYTPYSRKEAGPAIEMAAALVASLPGVPIVVEGRIWTIEDIQACFEAGVHSVVIGSAITVPEFITRRFVAAIPQRRQPDTATTSPAADAQDGTAAPAVDRYFDQLLDSLSVLRNDERPAIDAAAEAVARAVAAGRRIAVHDTGHLVSFELVARTGGLVALTRLTLPPADQPDRIEHALDSASVVDGSVLIIGSVSGTGVDVIDLADAARGRGATVVAITAPQHSGRLEPAHPSARRLMDAADIVLDNHAAYGDAFLDIPPLEREVVPFSGFGAVALMWAVVAGAVERLLDAGIHPSVYRSIHLPGGPADVARIEERYREKGH